MRLTGLVLFLLVSVGCNRSPKARAGFDQFAVVGNSVVLDASKSKDPDGDSLDMRWVLPDEVSLVSEDGARVTVVPEQPGEFEVVLRVSDGNATDTDRVVVRADDEPHLLIGSCGPDGFPLLEFDLGLNFVREFARFEGEGWATAARRAPDGSVLVLSYHHSSIDSGPCPYSVSRYSSGGQLAEVVLPRGVCEETLLRGVFDTGSAVLVIGYDGDLRSISEEGTTHMPLQVPGLLVWDVLAVDDSLIASWHFPGEENMGVAEFDLDGSMTALLLSSAEVLYPARLALLASDSFAVMAEPKGKIASLAGGTVQGEFEADVGTSSLGCGEMAARGVVQTPDGRIWAGDVNGVSITSAAGVPLGTMPVPGVAGPVAVTAIH